MALLTSPPEPEIVAAHAVLGLEMADDGLDGGPAAEFALDPGRHPSLLAGDEDPELVIGRRVVAAVSLVGDDARAGVAGERLYVRDYGRQRVTVIGIAGQRLHMGDELAALKGFTSDAYFGPISAASLRPNPARIIKTIS
jgi:hypothetical protein